QSVLLRILDTVRLPFAPRLQCMLPGRPSVIVADAFGGQLVAVDVARGRRIADYELAGPHVRRLALDSSGKDLLGPHPVLDQHAATTQENIERGVLMANVVRVLPLQKVLTTQAKSADTTQLIRLGSPGAGAADPAGLAVLDAGHLAVCLAGVGELALLDAHG